MTDWLAPARLPMPRRTLLAAALAAPLAAACAGRGPRDHGARERLAAIESGFDGRLGVFAIDTADGATLAHRGDERFPLCSTFKLVAAAALLARSTAEPRLMSERVHYTRAELASWSPVAEKHVARGMTYEELCAAAVMYSDNTAANLMLRRLGGPAALTDYARGLGDAAFRLDRWEPELNTAIPGDPRDTTTPAAMARTVRRLVLDDALPAPQRAQLEAWLRGNTTGATRIRAGVPSAWAVGDKTGAGDYGTSNDVGVLWPPERAPIVLAVYTTQRQPDAKARNDVIAEAARVVAQWRG